MCNDEKLRKSMGIESRRMVAERFRWDYIIDQYLGLMEDVILEKSYTK